MLYGISNEYCKKAYQPMETSQWICITNHLTDFYMMAALAFTRLKNNHPNSKFRKDRI